MFYIYNGRYHLFGRCVSSSTETFAARRIATDGRDGLLMVSPPLVVADGKTGFIAISFDAYRARARQWDRRHDAM